MLKDKDGQLLETPKGMLQRVAKNIAEATKTPEDEDFSDLIQDLADSTEMDADNACDSADEAKDAADEAEVLAEMTPEEVAAAEKLAEKAD